MERQLLVQLYRWLRSLEPPGQKRVQFSDLLIVLVFMWAVLRDAPTFWATRAENWPVEFA